MRSAVRSAIVGGMAPNRRILIRLGIGWTVAFALAHVYWAGGGRVGVPADSAPIAQRPAFLAYDIASALVLFAAAGIAARLLSTPTPWLRRITYIGALVALARGGVGVGQDALALSAGGGVSIGMLYDVWFTVAGVLFLLSVAGHATGTTSSRSTMSPVAPAATPRRPSTTT